jgi:hypothetical protein
MSEASLATRLDFETGLHNRQVSLVDLLDRLLAGGVVIQGQVTLAAAGVDLVRLDLGVMLASIDKAMSS